MELEMLKKRYKDLLARQDSKNANLIKELKRIIREEEEKIWEKK